MWNFCRRIMSSSTISSSIKTNANQLSSRATEAPPIEILDYGNLKKALAENKSYLIDVREINEIKESGMIPGFINIPVGEIESALQLSSEKFQKKYNASKPEYETPVIFSCRSGVRSFAACNKAVNLGFQKVANFDGGWIEWESKTGEQGKR